MRTSRLRRSRLGSGRRDPLGRFKAWLVTGAPARGLAFAFDFAVAARRGLSRRSRG